MPWKTIAAGTSTLALGDNSDPLNVLETFFWDSGAVSVTVVDAEDKPMLPDDKRIGGGVGPLC